MDVFVASRSNTEVDVCGACEGLWLDYGELERLIEKPVSEEPFDGATSRRCPVCTLTLSTVFLPGAVPVESCTSCRGLFLDAGELEQLAGRWVSLTPKDRDAWKRLVPAPPARAAEQGVDGFACVKCGQRFPLAQGNALASGLACRGCTPQIQTTEAERRAGNGPASSPMRRYLVWEALFNLLTPR